MVPRDLIRNSISNHWHQSYSDRLDDRFNIKFAGAAGEASRAITTKRKKKRKKKNDSDCRPGEQRQAGDARPVPLAGGKTARLAGGKSKCPIGNAGMPTVGARSAWEPVCWATMLGAVQGGGPSNGSWQ